MRREFRAPILGAFACIAGLGLLVYAAYSVGPVERLDLRIFLHFDDEDPSGRMPFGALIHLGDLGPLVVLTAIVVFLGLHFGRRRETLAALGVIVGANLTTQLLKLVLENPRNANAEGTVHFGWGEALPSADAFPSGHTTAAAAVAVALLFVVPAWHRRSAALVSLLLVVSMAVSVVVMTWHYPSDALGGILVAATWGFLMLAVLRLRRPRGHATQRRMPPVGGPWAASGSLDGPR